MTDDRASIGSRLVPVAIAVALLALVAAGMVGALPAGETTPDGETVLDRVEQRYANAETLTTNATVTVANDTTARSASVSLAAAEPNATRVAVRYNDSRLVAGTNGTVAWVYDPANDTVRVWNGSDARAAAGGGVDGQYGEATERGGNVSTFAGNHSHAAHGNVSALLAGNVTAETLRTETVDGDETYVVRLSHTNESVAGNATLWVDSEDYRVHRVELDRGEYRGTVEIERQRFNATIHESTFRPPDDADVVVVSRDRYDTFDEAQAATDQTLARLDGYTFDRAVVATRGDRSVTAQRYTGETNVTLVSTTDELPDGTDDVNGTNVTVAGANATHVERDESGAVFWTDDGVTRGVVADLSREALVDLATEVR
jgi:outer membrane lipoprotein-sorting protein